MTSAKPQSILVVGGTGRTGILTVKELLSRKQESNENFEITVAFRSKERFDEKFQEDASSLSQLQFDLSDFNSYPTSLANYDTIIFTHGAFQWINFTRFFRMLVYSFWPQHPYYTEFQSIVHLVDIATKTNPNVKFIGMSYVLICMQFTCKNKTKIKGKKNIFCIIFLHVSCATNITKHHVTIYI